MRTFGFLFLLTIGAAMAVDQPRSTVVEPPFWRLPTMVGDPLFFIQEDGRDLATASLLFLPTAAPRLTSSTGEVTYEPDQDFTWTKGSRDLVLTKGSRIPFRTVAQMHPARGAPQSINQSRDGKTAIFFSLGRVFHDLQVLATYDHTEAWDGATPRFAGERLPKTLAKLKAKQPLRYVALGDSITFGHDASALANAKPMQPPYAGLVPLLLREHFHAEVALTNLAISGKASGWGVTMAPKVAAEHPDLVSIAFGMNETGLAAAKFSDNIRATMDAVRKAAPDAEFILVAGMAGNPEWSALRPAAFPEFRDALAKLSGEGVVLADVTAVWLDLLKRKKFADLTGNGVNHPNDFGHRVYAQVLGALLME